MTIVAASPQENTILLPSWLMKLLNLHEGQQIQTLVKGYSLHMTPLEEFLALEGIFEDDNNFDEAIVELNEGWKKWEMQLSV